MITPKKCPSEGRVWMTMMLCLASIHLNAQLGFDQNKTDWMYRAKVGVSTHYTANWGNLDTLSAAFDAEKVAQQLEHAGAGWFLFTLHHQSWAMMAPNSTLDDIVGSGVQTADRDVPRDLIQVLAPKGTKLMLYVNLRLDPASKCPETVRNSMGGWPPNDTLFTNIAKVYREFSLRYGRHVAGWWVDGPHPDIKHSAHREKWFRMIADALRAGNPDAIIAFNYSLVEWYGMTRFTPNADYTPGESDTITYIPRDRWVEGAQCHLWTYLGEFWGQPGTRFSDRQLIDYIRKVTATGCAMTLEVGTMARSGRNSSAGSNAALPIGSIDPKQVEQIRVVTDHLRKAGHILE